MIPTTPEYGTVLARTRETKRSFYGEYISIKVRLDDGSIDWYCCNDLTIAKGERVSIQFLASTTIIKRVSTTPSVALNQVSMRDIQSRILGVLRANGFCLGAYIKGNAIHLQGKQGSIYINGDRINYSNVARRWFNILDRELDF